VASEQSDFVELTWAVEKGYEMRIETGNIYTLYRAGAVNELVELCTNRH